MGRAGQRVVCFWLVRIRVISPEISGNMVLAYWDDSIQQPYCHEQPSQKRKFFCKLIQQPHHTFVTLD